MGHARAVLLVLFVTGFALFAYGTTYRGQEAGLHVDVASIEPEDVPDGADVVQYRDLPEPVREAFDRARASDSMASVAAASSAIEADYVEYDGRYYRVTIHPRGEGGSPVELPLGLMGLVLSALSTVVYLLLRREARA